MVKTQLTLECFPKPKGGARPGAGRKKTAPKSTTVRVAEAVAYDCRRINDDYKQGLYTLDANKIVLPVAVHPGPRTILRKYAAEQQLSLNEAAYDLLCDKLAELYPPDAE